jgi:putative colanic acid biosynthesis UDP-glucose lipid carrier transferase
MRQRVNYDLYYIEHWALWLDLKIIFRTFIHGFRGKNAY